MQYNMTPETDRVQRELKTIKAHRADLQNYLKSLEMTPEIACALLTDGSLNAVEYIDVIKSLSVSLLTNNQILSSLVIQKLSSYNPGNIPSSIFCEALTYTDRSTTLYLYASYRMIESIPEAYADDIRRIVNLIKADMEAEYPNIEPGRSYKRAIDQLKELLKKKRVNI